jgi:hypothetical protein
MAKCIWDMLKCAKHTKRFRKNSREEHLRQGNLMNLEVEVDQTMLMAIVVMVDKVVTAEDMEEEEVVAMEGEAVALGADGDDSNELAR